MSSDRTPSWWSNPLSGDPDTTGTLDGELGGRWQGVQLLPSRSRPPAVTPAAAPLSKAGSGGGALEDATNRSTPRELPPCWPGASRGLFACAHPRLTCTCNAARRRLGSQALPRPLSPQHRQQARCAAMRTPCSAPAACVRCSAAADRCMRACATRVLYMQARSSASASGRAVRRRSQRSSKRHRRSNARVAQVRGHAARGGPCCGAAARA